MEGPQHSLWLVINSTWLLNKVQDSQYKNEYTYSPACIIWENIRSKNRTHSPACPWLTHSPACPWLTHSPACPWLTVPRAWSLILNFRIWEDPKKGLLHDKTAFWSLFTTKKLSCDLPCTWQNCVLIAIYSEIFVMSFCHVSPVRPYTWKNGGKWTLKMSWQSTWHFFAANSDQNAVLSCTWQFTW
jgi:hypothetical protein